MELQSLTSTIIKMAKHKSNSSYSYIFRLIFIIFALLKHLSKYILFLYKKRLLSFKITTNDTQI